MIAHEFLFGLATGCLLTLVVMLLIFARLLSPFMKDAFRKNRHN